MGKNADRRNVGEIPAVETSPGVYRSTLCYNEGTMLCHFRIRKGATIPLHHHVAAQNGYVISGRVRFIKGGGESFVATGGAGYLFDPEELHGLEALDDTELVECFSPMRPEYADDSAERR